MKCKIVNWRHHMALFIILVLVFVLTSCQNKDVSESNSLSVFGNASVISSDDYLLDGNFSNGELVNGSIYHSKWNAVIGVVKDKIDAKLNNGLHSIE